MGEGWAQALASLPSYEASKGESPQSLWLGTLLQSSCAEEMGYIPGTEGSEPYART